MILAFDVPFRPILTRLYSPATFDNLRRCTRSLKKSDIQSHKVSQGQTRALYIDISHNYQDQLQLERNWDPYPCPFPCDKLLIQTPVRDRANSVYISCSWPKFWTKTTNHQPQLIIKIIYYIRITWIILLTDIYVRKYQDPMSDWQIEPEHPIIYLPHHTIKPLLIKWIKNSTLAY